MNFLYFVIILVLFIVNNNKIKKLEMQLKELKKQLNTSKIANNNLSTIKSHSFDESIEVTSINLEEQNSKINTNFDEEQSFISNSNTDFSKETITSNSVQTNNESKDYEKLIGKKFMNICASVLIFISLILFAQVIYPNLTDEIKVIGMYLISFAFFIFGFYRLQKNPNNVFNISVTSCGLGAIYISIILTNIYFKFINDITLYLLIATWAIFVSYLSRLKNSNIFHIIGEFGITIALIFGLNNETSINNIMLLTIFMIVGSITFYFSNKSNSNLKNIINNIFNLINIQLISFELISSSENNFITFSTILIIGFIAYNIIDTFIKMKPDNKSDFFAAIFIALYIIEFYRLLFIIIADYQIINGLFTLLTICLLIFTELKFKEHNYINKILLQIFSFIFIAIFIIGTDILTKNGFYAILAILFTAYGFTKNGIAYKYASFAYLILHTLDFSMPGVASFILGTVAFSYLLYKIMTDHENYNLILKCLSYAFMQVFFLIQGIHLFIDLKVKFETSAVLLYSVMSLLNILAASRLFSKNPINNDMELITKWLTGSFNIIFMFVSLIMIGVVNNLLLKLIVILTSVAVYMVNSTNILKMFKYKMWPGIYVGLKLTILIITILMSFHVASILISIICLFISIMCIVLGFSMKYKSIRIYGLILSLISIAKLILLDIKYSSTLEHAISIFVCGILCFAVSSIYNYVDKKMIDDTND